MGLSLGGAGCVLATPGVAPVLIAAHRREPPVW
jgi:hypothetical protein